MAETERTYGTIVTDVGTNLITAAVMDGTKVNITTLAVGDGGGAYYQPTPNMTALKNPCWSGPVKSVSKDQDLETAAFPSQPLSRVCLFLYSNDIFIFKELTRIPPSLAVAGKLP